MKQKLLVWTIQPSGVRFIAVDMPEANDLTVGIMALVAQTEREAISRRTKEALTEAADLALRALKSEGIAGVKIIKLGYWTFINAATEAVLFPEGLLSWELEHAAVMETSVMLHLVPHLVRKDLIPDGPPADFPAYDVYPFDTKPIPPTGVLSSAASATAAKGEAVLAQVVPDIASAMQAAWS